jgi:hypothetical protein
MTDEPRPRSAAPRAAFAPVELANPSTMMGASGARHGALGAEPALAPEVHPAAAAYDAGTARATPYDAGVARAAPYGAAPRSTAYDAGAARATGYDAGAPALNAVTR